MPTDSDGPEQDRTTVLIVDDQYVVREGLRAVLTAGTDFTCVGEARNGVEAIELANELLPDIIVMDLKMPEMDGITATRSITRKHPKIRIVALTMYEDDASVIRAMEAGARGYLLKGATHDEIVQTLRMVATGALVLSSEVADPINRYFTVKGQQAPSPFPELTPREGEILQMLCKGLGDNRIADELGITSKTVRNHVASILHRIGVTNRTQAVIKARDAGIDRTA